MTEFAPLNASTMLRRSDLTLQMPAAEPPGDGHGELVPPDFQHRLGGGWEAERVKRRRIASVEAVPCQIEVI